MNATERKYLERLLTKLTCDPVHSPGHNIGASNEEIREETRLLESPDYHGIRDPQEVL